MKFYGVITEAHPSWFLGENKCQLLWYLCPNKEIKIVNALPVFAHDHLLVIRFSETHPVSKYGGNEYLNIWKMTRLDNNEIRIEPSIDAKNCFHTSNPVYFKIIDSTDYGDLWNYTKGEI